MRNELRQYLKDHAQIFAGKDLNRVMELFSNLSLERDWTVEEEEAITALFEAYRSDPRNIHLDPEVRGVLSRIAAFMQRVYKGIRNNVRLNEDIAKSFDAIMGVGVNTSSANSNMNAGGGQTLNQELAAVSPEEIANKNKEAFSSALNTVFANPEKYTVEGKTYNGEIPTSISGSIKLFQKLTSDIRSNVYTNIESGLSAVLGKTAIHEISKHDWTSIEHLASILQIPEIFDVAKQVGKFFIDEGRSFDYFVSLFNYGDKQYLIRSSIRFERNYFYYDHKLSDAKKFRTGLIRVCRYQICA